MSESSLTDHYPANEHSYRYNVPDGTDSVSFGPGDLVVFPQNLECTWNVTEAVTKHYNFG